MPIFRLEPPDKHDERTQYRMLHAKKTYSPPVKIVNWDRVEESMPIDIDPYCHEGKINYFLSHYKHLGANDVQPYVTTTMEMLNEINVAHQHFRYKKPLINYISYKDTLPCEVKNEICPTRCVSNYVSTMQYSYTPPYPYVVQRLSCPIIPFFQNRKLGHEDPNLSPHKFYDEGFPEVTCELRKHKAFRWKSFNPSTGTFNDGTPVPENKKGCYKLQFEDENLKKKYLLKGFKCTSKLKP